MKISRLRQSITPRKLLRVFSLAVGFASIISTPLTAQFATVSFSTDLGGNRLIVGVPGEVRIHLDAATDTVRAQSYRLVWHFTNGNIVGPLYDSGANPTVVVTNRVDSVYETVAWHLNYGVDFTDPDTTVGTLIDFGGQPIWNSPGESFIFKFTPSDTGGITIGDKLGGTPFQTEIQDNHGDNLIVIWQDTILEVVPCASMGLLSGDCNRDSIHTSADIIWLVNFVFKGGASPLPFAKVGDANCSDSITSADIVYLVNYVFKSGLSPCDLCSAL